MSIINKVWIDNTKEKCIACGSCECCAEQVFRVDTDSAEVVLKEFDGSYDSYIMEAVYNCPAECIKFTRGEPLDKPITKVWIDHKVRNEKVCGECAMCSRKCQDMFRSEPDIGKYNNTGVRYDFVRVMRENVFEKFDKKIREIAEECPQHAIKFSTSTEFKPTMSFEMALEMVYEMFPKECIFPERISDGFNGLGSLENVFGLHTVLYSCGVLWRPMTEKQRIKYERSRRCSFDLLFDHSGFSYTMYVKNLMGEPVKARSSKADYYKITVEAFRKFLTEQLELVKMLK